MNLTPLRFEPFLRPMVWGGRRLGERLGKHLQTNDPYGESWEISDHALHQSRVAEGPWTGKSLRSLMTDCGAALVGPDYQGHATFPWLVKFLDCHDWLSVQVHPDEQKVAILWPGERSKTEAWFVLEAAPTARIYAGLKEGVDENTLRRALAVGKVADCLHSFVPRCGDCVFLPAGTVHAVGGGVLMAEVQQTSDATFRLFDWNRLDAQGQPRKLHIEEAMAALHWDQGPVQPVHAEGFDAVSQTSHSWQRLCACPFFELDFMGGREEMVMREGRLQTLIVVGGAGTLRSATGEVRVETGQAWVLPASLSQASCLPDPYLSAIVCA